MTIKRTTIQYLGMSEEHKTVLAAIGYIPVPPLFWIPLFLAGDDEYARYHGRQALVLQGLLVLTILVFGLLLHYLFIWARPIQLVFDFVGGLLYILVGVLSVIGLIKAAQGKLWRIPVLGAYSDRMKL